MAGRGGAARPNGPAAGNKICQFKLVLLGESAVGKSSLVLRFVKGQFHEYQESTIGAAFLTQTVCLDDTTVKFEIWDTAGQERYHSLAPMYYRGAQAAIVVYDITNTEGGGAALPHPASCLLLGHVCTGQELGEGAAEAGQPQHRNCISRQQGRPCEQESRGFPGSPDVCGRQQLAVHGDLGEDSDECERNLYGNSQEAAEKRTPNRGRRSGQESGRGPARDQPAQQKPVLQQLSRRSHLTEALPMTWLESTRPNRTYGRAAGNYGCRDFSISF
ncbi:uncharacterized protein LOC135978138 isoform X1 [Chrysemys picta bellii]|uniref:uncharacterized protein LOC135978138 isoform X1 n=1 Tax=Chrysemys picta bellii TaxID=8478 RepID=UPI0032B1750C